MQRYENLQSKLFLKGQRATMLLLLLLLLLPGGSSTAYVPSALKL
jgi:hypothetical protein